MRKDLSVYLLHIRDALESIAVYTRAGKRAFFADPMIQDAVIYNLAIIGEAVKRLPPSFRSRHPDIPWKRIAGMRDVVIHDYDSTELTRIWGIVQRDAPTLLKDIHRLLRTGPHSNGSSKAA